MSIENSKYYLNFRGNLNIGASGSIVSPVFDTESENFAIQWTSYIYSVNTPAGTSISWTFRSAATLSATLSASYTSNIQSCTGRFLQAKAVITKSDASLTTAGPVISYFVPEAKPLGKAVTVEESGENLIRASQTLGDTSYWSLGNVTVLSDCTIAPDGTFTGDKVMENSANNYHEFYDSVMTPGSAGTVSIYAKAAERNVLYIGWSNGTVNGASFDVSSGVVLSTNGSGIAADIKYVKNGWYRCIVTASSVPHAGVVFELSNGSHISYAGTTGYGMYLWGAQAEAKEYATSYIPTATGAVTRNNENLSFSSTNVFDDINSGSAIVRFKIATQSSGDKSLIDLGNTGASGFFLYISGTTLLFQMGGSAGAITSISSGPIYADNWYTVGIKWGSWGQSLYVNGVFAGSGSVGANIIPEANFFIGSNQAVARFLNGLISDVVLYNGELEHSELLAYTMNGATIPLDYRTAYSLRFENNLNHGEGGSRTNVSKDLEQVGIVTNSNITWTETEAASSSGLISWNTAANVTITANKIQKTGGIDSTWDAEAYSDRIMLADENGYISFTSNENNTGKMFGFSESNVSGSFPSISHAIYLNSAANTLIYENGSAVGAIWTSYTNTDVFSIERKNGVVSYLKNGVSLYTSSLPSTGSVQAKAVFYNLNGTIDNVALYFYPRVDVDTSINDGATWNSASSGSVINGLSGSVSAAGKDLKIRQKLTTPKIETIPSLSEISWSITQSQTKNKNEHIQPLYSSLKFTPTDVSKWQLENKVFSTSYQLDGVTRTVETLTIPSTGIINVSSGSVIMRAYFDDSVVSNDYQTLFEIGNTGNLLSFYRSINSDTYILSISNGSGGNSITTTTPLTTGWHSFGIRWGAGRSSIYIDGAEKTFRTDPVLLTALISDIFVLNNRNNGEKWNGPLSQIDIFGEFLTDSEMVDYTAASGAVISVTRKHTYQLKFQNNLEYGMTGIYTSRVMDSQVPSARWATYRKQDVVPENTSIIYQFCASNNQAGPFENYTTDITAITGRYIKVKIICMSSDVNNFNPQVLDNTVRVYPKSV